jgi:hypothetical protein
MNDFDTIDDVKAALAEGTIGRGDAVVALQEEFEMSEEDAIDLVDTWPEDTDDA